MDRKKENELKKSIGYRTFDEAVREICHFC